MLSRRQLIQMAGGTFMSSVALQFCSWDLRRQLTWFTAVWINPPMVAAQSEEVLH
jgi:hypothetical protein